MMINVITLEKVSRYYGKGDVRVQALDQIDLDIQLGEFTAIVGPSGSGKSTLLNLVGGLDSPNSGTVKLSGKSISSMSGNELSDFRRDHIGFIFQAYNLIPVLTAAENVEYIMLLQGLPPLERRKRVAEIF